MSLNDTLSSIQTKEELTIFLRELLDDLRLNPSEWENSSLELYLEALAAWTEDADGYYANRGIPVPQQPSWKTIAELLLASKYYE